MKAETDGKKGEWGDLFDWQNFHLLFPPLFIKMASCYFFLQNKWRKNPKKHLPRKSVFVFVHRTKPPVSWVVGLHGFVFFLLWALDYFNSPLYVFAPNDTVQIHLTPPSASRLDWGARTLWSQISVPVLTHYYSYNMAQHFWLRLIHSVSKTPAVRVCLHMCTACH